VAVDGLRGTWIFFLPERRESLPEMLSKGLRLEERFKEDSVFLFFFFYENLATLKLSFGVLRKD
jgi:hypothetical protein